MRQRFKSQISSPRPPSSKTSEQRRSQTDRNTGTASRSGCVLFLGSKPNVKPTAPSLVFTGDVVRDGRPARAIWACKWDTTPEPDRGRSTSKPDQTRPESCCAGLWSPCRVSAAWFGAVWAENYGLLARFLKVVRAVLNTLRPCPRTGAPIDGHPPPNLITSQGLGSTADR